MHRRYTCGVDETPVKGIYGPGAIELKAASGADNCGLDFDGIEGFDGMDLDAGEAWIGGGRTARAHRPTLAEKLPSPDQSENLSRTDGCNDLPRSVNKRTIFRDTAAAATPNHFQKERSAPTKKTSDLTYYLRDVSGQFYGHLILIPFNKMFFLFIEFFGSGSV
jgi:hypothetical protein